MSFLPLVKAWVWVSLLASAAGWGLSACGQLNRTGYTICALVAMACALAWRFIPGVAAARQSAAAMNRVSQRRSAETPLRKLRRRFRRCLPLTFLALAALIFVGGALYPPSNHAGFTYRTPRVLNWLTEGHWFWIHTPDYRMNTRACGFEWLTAPLLLFTKSDRSLFLINFASFLLLPGLVFSVFRRLGVRGRVAWYWMWLLPTGYNFLLQAGSTANDTYPAVYALAAMDFGLRAWASRRPADLWPSILSAGLLTGAKATNLTLLLPWAVVVVPLLPLLLRRLWATVPVLMLAAMVSFLPSAALNVRYLGEWSGMKLERQNMAMKNPIVGVWGNGLLLLKNFVPPFFPAAGWWNRSALTVLPRPIREPMVQNFEPGFHLIGEMPTEDGAGLGFGLSVLIACSVAAALMRKPRPGNRPDRHGLSCSPPSPSPQPSPLGRGRMFDHAEKCSPPDEPGRSGKSCSLSLRERVRVRGKEAFNRIVAPEGPPGQAGAVPSMVLILACLTPWVSLAVYCTKSGVVDAARLISVYYPLLLPSLLIGTRQAEVVRQYWWRGVMWAGLGLAALVVLTIPGRPLWPAQTVLAKVLSLKPGQRQAARALDVYTVYGNRWDPLAAVRTALPKGLAVVGFLGDGDDIDISLWRPFFSRQVKHILIEDTPEQIRQQGIEYAVVSGSHLTAQGTTLSAWLARARAERLNTVTATVTLTMGPQEWHIVRFLQP